MDAADVTRAKPSRPTRSGHVDGPRAGAPDLLIPARSPAAGQVGRPGWERLALRLALVPPLLFVLTTIPGVRPEPGYDLLLDGLLNNVAYEMAAVICLLRLRRQRENRVAGYLLALALALYGCGNVVWTVLVRPQEVPPFPSQADALWLAFYPLVFAALTLMLRRRDRRPAASLWLDGLVGALAVSAVAAAAVIGPILGVEAEDWAAVATTTAYPLLDLLLLLVTGATLALFRWRPPAGWWLLTAGLVLFVVADVAYLFAVARGTYESGGITDGVWVLATVLMALTPGWPTRPTGLHLPTWALLAIPLVSTAAALALLVADHQQPLHPVAVALAAATVAVAMLRLVVMFKELTALADSRRLALTDELTELGNRRALYEDAPKRIAALDREGSVALLLLDLDRFKEVNDTLGHQVGDAMLRDIGRRLKAFVPDRADLVVRLGGDEFAFLVTARQSEAARLLAEDVREALGRPLDVDGVPVRVEASIGIAELPAPVADLPTLLRCADVAMYHAKSRRLGVFSYEPELDEFTAADRLETIAQLRDAVVHRRLLLHYQPKIDCRSGAVCGVEALVRWRHPTRGLLLPSEFLALVDDANLMTQLTQGVLEQALDQAALWHHAGRCLPVAVNVSAEALADHQLPERIDALLEARDLPGRCLTIEITEDLLMGDRARAQAILGRLRAGGVRVSIDDYGTGYSSLAYLMELPVDELKLDRAFVARIGKDPRARAIVSSTILLAHSLDLDFVAEGVEDEETSRALRAAGCDIEQGWFHGGAQPVSEIERWLASREVPGWRRAGALQAAPGPGS